MRKPFEGEKYKIPHLFWKYEIFWCTFFAALKLNQNYLSLFQKNYIFFFRLVVISCKTQFSFFFNENIHPELN